MPVVTQDSPRETASRTLRQSVEVEGQMTMRTSLPFTLKRIIYVPEDRLKDPKVQEEYWLFIKSKVN